MIQHIHIQDKSEAKRVLAVQIPAYKVEAQLIGFSDIPYLFDTPETLQASGETFYGYFVEEELAGVISYKKDKNILDIHRLVVHPSYFRKGIAGSLLQFIQEREPVIQKIIVSTGAKNEPAITLYQKHGFVEARTMEVADGVFITCLCKEKREFV